MRATGGAVSKERGADRRLGCALVVEPGGVDVLWEHPLLDPVFTLALCHRVESSADFFEIEGGRIVG